MRRVHIGIQESPRDKLVALPAFLLEQLALNRNVCIVAAHVVRRMPMAVTLDKPSRCND